MGVNGIELMLRQRPIAPSKVHWDIVNPTGCEAAIEMPQSRHDHAHQGGLDSGPGLIEHQKIDAGLLGKTHTGYLLAHRMANFEPRPGCTAGWLLGAKNEWTRRRTGVVPSKVDFSPLPPPMRPIYKTGGTACAARRYGCQSARRNRSGYVPIFFGSSQY